MANNIEVVRYLYMTVIAQLSKRGFVYILHWSTYMVSYFKLKYCFLRAADRGPVEI
jgi:hypothetical protein